MTLLDDWNSNPRGKWGWWGDPNITDKDIVDYEMRQKKLNLPIEWGGFGGMVPRIDEVYGYIPGKNSTMPTIFGGMNPPINNMALGTDPFGGGVMGGLAGRYGLWGGLGGLIGAGLGKLFNK